MHCVQRETLVETQGDLNRVAQAFLRVQRFFIAGLHSISIFKE